MLPEGYEVVKQEWEDACQHPACDFAHRHLYNANRPESALIEVWNLRGEYVGVRREGRYHEITRTEWVILLDGKRVGDSHGTRREARAEAMTRPTV
jgi:hypothetical protein